MNNRPHNLHPEKNFWQGSPSKRVAGTYPLACIAALAGLIYYVPDIAWRIQNFFASLPFIPPGWSIFTPLAALIAFMLPSLWSFLGQVMTSFECTSERLIIRRGILIRTEDEVELYRVVDVVQSANLIQMVMGVGTVTVKSTDQTGNVTMPSITKASDVRNAIRTASEDCKTRRGTIRLLNEGGGTI
jgi:uncharacterized membrane protein YdbT with pleckstrin-like domain